MIALNAYRSSRQRIMLSAEITPAFGATPTENSDAASPRRLAQTPFPFFAGLQLRVEEAALRVSFPPVANASTATALCRAYPFNDIVRRTLARDGAEATTDVVSVSLPRNDRFPRAMLLAAIVLSPGARAPIQANSL